MGKSTAVKATAVSSELTGTPAAMEFLMQPINRCWSLMGGRYGVSVYKWAMGSGSWSSSQPFGLERAKMGASKVSRTASLLTRTEECSKAAMVRFRQTQIQKRQLTREMIVCL